MPLTKKERGALLVQAKYWKEKLEAAISLLQDDSQDVPACAHFWAVSDAISIIGNKLFDVLPPEYYDLGAVERLIEALHSEPGLKE